MTGIFYSCLVGIGTTAMYCRVHYSTVTSNGTGFYLDICCKKENVTSSMFENPLLNVHLYVGMS